MRNDNSLGAAFSHRYVQAFPIGMIGNRKAPVHRPPSSRSPERHPSGRNGPGEWIESFHPWRVHCRGRRDHERAAQQLFWRVGRNSLRGLQGYARLNKRFVDIVDSAVREDRAYGMVDALQYSLGFANGISKQDAGFFPPHSASTIHLFC